MQVKDKIFIKQKVISPPLALAPMAGVTNHPFRYLCKEMGCGLLVSEMISAKSLLYQSARDTLLFFAPEERPFAYQIFGSDPAEMAEAALILEARNPDFIDINLGCPAPKIVKGGAGAALLKEPRKVYSIVRSVVDAVKVPVTVKIRKGWSSLDKQGLKVALLAEEAGAAAVTVHGRFREQMYCGKADWFFIEEVASFLTIPVIGNGDITSAYDIYRALKETSCAGVMVGRGAVGNPWIFKQAAALLAGAKTYHIPSPQEKVAMAKRHLHMMVNFKGAKVGVLEMRRHCASYLKGLPGASAARDRLHRAETPQEMLTILDEFKTLP